MKIDGKELADAILGNLTQQVLQLKKEGIVPTLAVLLVGDNVESLAYIRQKKIATEKIGGRFIFEHLPLATQPRELEARVQMYNNDPGVTGLIIQRPLPIAGDYRVHLHKDIDGFEPNSPFEIPIVMAIFEILKKINVNFRTKNIVIVGRGQTAGKPIADAFETRQCATAIIHSHTPHPQEIMKSADIIISCVGKERVVTAGAVKPGATVLSVGLWRSPEGKIKGDYEEDEISGIAGYYSPTPGGVGPINVACLMQNLVKASIMK